MFKFLFNKLKNILKTASPQSPAIPYCRQSLQEGEKNNSQAFSSQMSMDELRGKIIRDELMSETAGIEANTLKIVESADEITYSKQVQSLTGNGLETNSHEFLIRTAEGHLIKAAELHGGGTCGICKKHTDRKHFRHCSICQIPLCSSCSKKFKELILCPVHYRHAVFHNNTWDED